MGAGSDSGGCASQEGVSVTWNQVLKCRVGSSRVRPGNDRQLGAETSQPVLSFFGPEASQLLSGASQASTFSPHSSKPCHRTLRSPPLPLSEDSRSPVLRLLHPRKHHLFVALQESSLSTAQVFPQMQPRQFHAISQWATPLPCHTPAALGFPLPERKAKGRMKGGVTRPCGQLPSRSTFQPHLPSSLPRNCPLNHRLHLCHQLQQQGRRCSLQLTNFSPHWHGLRVEVQPCRRRSWKKVLPPSLGFLPPPSHTGRGRRHLLGPTKGRLSGG